MKNGFFTSKGLYSQEKNSFFLLLKVRKTVLLELSGIKKILFVLCTSGLIFSTFSLLEEDRYM
jgi:hypothetical protein